MYDWVISLIFVSMAFGEWDPVADCDGISAEDRMRWLLQEKGMSAQQAKEQVMSEFPFLFARQVDTRWNPQLFCGEYTAEQRQQWLMKEKGMASHSAKEQVMVEFPQVFAANDRWNPDVDCNGSTADQRVQWLIRETGLTGQQAQWQVMAEFAALFPKKFHSEWHPALDCQGSTADDRRQWLITQQGMSDRQAQQQVMNEFPAVFSSWTQEWNPEVQCTGEGGTHSSATRAQWLIENRGVAMETARELVMMEYPGNFVTNPFLSGDQSLDLRTSALSKCSGGLGGNSCKPPGGYGPLSFPAASRLVFTSEFDYEGPIDSSKWSYDTGGHGWGNNELQYYTDRPENAWVSEGTLKIRAWREDFSGNRFTSAKLVSKGHGDWVFGRMEVRARLPVGRGSWSAIWMLPTETAYGGWPKGGEIDIMEHVGHDSNRVHGTVHTEDLNHMKNTQVGATLVTTVSDWHTYAVEWNAAEIAFYVDGDEYFRFKNDKAGRWQTWPFDHPFHLVLNVAVGGDWGGKNGVDEDAFTGAGQIMEVSWVRVYQ